MTVTPTVICYNDRCTQRRVRSKDADLKDIAGRIDTPGAMLGFQDVFEPPQVCRLRPGLAWREGWFTKE